MDLKETGRVDPNKFWYYVYKGNFIVEQTLRFKKDINTLFDVGAGSGYFASKFKDLNPKIEAFCIDPFYSHSDLGKKNGMNFVLKSPQDQADTLLFIDVLEHVEDDAMLLKEYLDKSAEGALFIISVPAFQSLWSNHDIYLEHFRRYRIQDLRKLLNKVGLEEVHSSYIFGSLFPVIWFIRQFRKRVSNQVVDSDLKQSSRIVNMILLAILKCEKFLLVNKFFGTSALIIAKKTSAN
jgi:SAM-dependent methyltransferase